MKTKTAVGVGLFILSAFIVLPTHRVQACSCAIPESAGKELENSDAVFVGTVDDVSGSSLYGAETFDVDFSIEKVFKGSDSTKQTLKTPTDSAACGYSFTEGEKYLVFAREWGTNGEDDLTISLCSLTQVANEATDAIEELNAIVSPVTPAEDDGTIRMLMERIIELLRQLLVKYAR